MPNADTIKQLNAKIRQLQRPQSKPDSEFHETVTGIEAFDALLPTGGLSSGTLIEWLSPQGGGGSTLATTLAARLLNEEKEARTLVVIDTNNDFYPPAVTNLGVSLSQVVIIRPKHIGEAIWAFEQSLRCSGVTITMAWIDHLTDQTFRRLQLATEAGGGVGFLFRPTRMRKQRSWADARFLVEPVSASEGAWKSQGAEKPPEPSKPLASSVPSDSRARSAFSSGWGSRQCVPGVPRITSTPTLKPFAKLQLTRRLKVQLLHCRGRIEGGQVELEINDETGDVHLASRLASPTNQPRKARA